MLSPIVWKWQQLDSVLVSFLAAVTKKPNQHNCRREKVYLRAHSFRGLVHRRPAPFLGAQGEARHQGRRVTEGSRPHGDQEAERDLHLPDTNI